MRLAGDVFLDFFSCKQFSNHMRQERGRVRVSRGQMTDRPCVNGWVFTEGNLQRPKNCRTRICRSFRFGLEALLTSAVFFLTIMRCEDFLPFLEACTPMQYITYVYFRINIPLIRFLHIMTSSMLILVILLNLM